MAQASFPRLRALGRGGAGLVRDLFSTRLCVAAAGLWRPVRFLSVLLIAVLLGCLWLAGGSAKSVYLVLRPATEWPVGPAIAAIVVFVVLLELFCASVTMGLRALLRLSYDTGRHRIGTLLIMLSLSATALVLIDVVASPLPSLAWGVIAFLLVLILGTLWFERVYRRPAYPRFRDFHADVVAARTHLARIAHGG
jgi:hypothetical protein